MSIAEKTAQKLDVAQQESGQATRQAVEYPAPPEHESKSFFSLRIVALLGMTVGVSLVAAVVLFIGKVPSEIPAVTLVEPSGTDIGPVNRIQSGSIVSSASVAMSKKVSAEHAPAISPIAKSKTDVPPSAETGVRLAVTQWAAAWSRQDAESYLACYADDFNVPDGMSRAAWEAQRKSRIAKPRSIKVVLTQVEVSLASDGIATVRLVQDFRADNYRETGTKKELRLRNENGRWRIFSEKVI